MKVNGFKFCGFGFLWCMGLAECVLSTPLSHRKCYMAAVFICMVV